MTRLLVLGLLVALACAARPDAPKLRALWVDVFHDGIKTPLQVHELIARANRAGVNTLFIQVRSRAQVYHFSLFEPRAPDTIPWFDGLREVIRLANAQDPPIQVHAWLNAHPFWPDTYDPPWPNHTFFRHPDWLTRNPGGRTDTPVGRALDFGHPDAADYLLRLYLEVVRKYAVDGIHLDFIRYAGSEWGYNEVSLRRFWESGLYKGPSKTEIRKPTADAPPTGLPDSVGIGIRPPGTQEAEPWAFTPEDLPPPTDPVFSRWRREQVTGFVRRLVHHAKALRPELIISAAAIPWGDAPKDFRETPAYTRCFQDWKAWSEEGLLDLIIPMFYFKETDNGAYFRNWVSFCQTLKTKSPIAAGIGNWLNTHDDTLLQARHADERLAGVSFFSYASTNPMPGQEAELFNEEFYKKIGELPRAEPIPPNLNGILSRPVTFGYRLNADLEPAGPDLGFYSEYDNARRQELGHEEGAGLGMLVNQVDRISEAGDRPVLRRHASVFRLEDASEFILVDQIVVRQTGTSLVLADPLTRKEIIAILAAPPDPPLMPGDLVAVQAVRNGNTIMAGKVKWLGATL